MYSEATIKLLEMLEEKDWFVCINKNTQIYLKKIKLYSYTSPADTSGKSNFSLRLSSTSEDDAFYFAGTSYRSDDDVLEFFNKNFKLLSEYRKEKIEKILKD